MSESGISQAQIDAILKFLPAFESEGVQFGEWHLPEGQFPRVDLSEEASALKQALYKNGWIVPFDWGEWQDQDVATKYVESPNLVAETDVETIQKLFTTHVRADRFCEGHLAARFEKGHILTLLRRLCEIIDSMDA